ncbi:3'-5' exoribonuclease 1 isoform X2 [Amia ocellicauda]|uniref:3'-5' exoribonuclease 1 isoform X2 n=1 Tax=Amia ocellicauda TaxID=2972642 RepID=UPI00346387CF
MIMQDQKENIKTQIENKLQFTTPEMRDNVESKSCCRPDGAAEEAADCSVPSKSDFSDPVYKEIAVANGHINRMNKDELRTKLAELKLETRGVKDVLKKRLKSYYKKQKLMQSVVAENNSTDTYYDYICVVDFEATCEESNPPDYLHEIIEFPMVLINTRTLEMEDTFQAYVKPEIHPDLSDFCVQLTGITQETVDKADTFPDVLQKVVVWLQERELGTKYKYAVLTDGSWDMSKFLNIQCRVPRTQTKLSSMLEKLGMKYEGRPHSGLDDSRNIARIALRMLQDGCQLRVNERMHAGQLMSVPSSTPMEGAPAPCPPRYRN